MPTVWKPSGGVGSLANAQTLHARCPGSSPDLQDPRKTSLAVTLSMVIWGPNISK